MRKNKLVALIEFILRIALPVVLLITSYVFLGETSTLENNQEEEIMYKMIQFILYALDFIAVIFILGNFKTLLYDLEILKEKQHKIKIKN